MYRHASSQKKKKKIVKKEDLKNKQYVYTKFHTRYIFFNCIARWFLKLGEKKISIKIKQYCRSSIKTLFEHIIRKDCCGCVARQVDTCPSADEEAITCELISQEPHQIICAVVVNQTSKLYKSYSLSQTSISLVIKLKINKENIEKIKYQGSTPQLLQLTYLSMYISCMFTIVQALLSLGSDGHV